MDLWERVESRFQHIARMMREGIDRGELVRAGE